MKTRNILGTDLPLIQAPMAGAQGSALAIAVCEAGGLGSLPCAMLTPDAMRRELAAIRAGTSRPYNVNFFCHTPPEPSDVRETAWRAALAPYYREFGLDIANIPAGPGRAPFSAEAAGVLEEFKPAVVSFHFGRPARGILNRVMRELGPMNNAAPEFPLATSGITPLRAKAESLGSGDFSPLWSGQNASGCREIPAGELTRALAGIRS